MIGLRVMNAPADVDHVLQYISSYDGSAQAALEASSSDVLSTTSTRAAAIVDAVQNYYTNSSTVSSLDTDEYADNSKNLSEIFNLSNATSMAPVLVYGIIDQESGGGYELDNTNISQGDGDYGYGIMQLTEEPTSSDVYNLELFLDNNSSTQVASSGLGSQGDPSHYWEFSDVTNAVKAFQGLHSLPETGNVFYETRGALNSLLPTSTIPSDFQFDTNLALNSDDRLSDPNSTVGQVSGVTVPPCDNLQDPSNINYYQNCLGESSLSTPSKYYAPQSNYGDQTFQLYV
jgi:hypothetical protein